MKVSRLIIFLARKILGFFAITVLLLSQTFFVFAQTLDAIATEPALATEPAPTTDTTVIEETVAPPSDTAAPAFISVATASSEETAVNIVWTTDEFAYGFVEYGETTSYGSSTPKSASAALDHTISITGLAPGMTYHYRIVAQDEAGNISYSKDRTFGTALEVVAVDNVPPEIAEVSATGITASGATIGWVTDELAQGKVEYGKTAEYGASSSLTADYRTEHSTSLSNLEANTEYHFRIVVQDESGNQAVSPDEMFTTDPAPVASPEESTTTEVTEPESATSTSEETTVSTSPTASTTEEATGGTATATSTRLIISHVETVSVGTSTAVIVWQTNEPGTTQVLYGPGGIYASSTTISAALVTSHEVKLTRLMPGTNYLYKVISQNASGKTAAKEDFEFNTLYQEKKLVQAPAISNVSVSSIGTSTATIIWATDIPAGGEVKYGTTTAYGISDGGHTHLLTAHTHPLSGLSPDTRYNFVAIARDVYGNETIYENKTFTTLGDSSLPNSQSASVITNDTGESQEIVTDQTTVAPARNEGGGGDHSYTHTVTLKAPKLAKVEGLDGQAMFIWNPEKHPKATPGSTQIRTNTLIVRSPLRYPENPTLGKIVYKGNSGLFTDTNLENGKTYYYSIFRANQFNSYSEPTRFALMPKNKNEETKLEVVPPVVQKNPIYVFPKPLQIGDNNIHVAHLQVLLASKASLYPEGFITGYFGPLTARAVQAFQKRYKFPVTGIADAATLKKLEKLSSIEIIRDKATPYDNALARDLTLGASGEDVSVLQQFLIRVGVYPEALITGYFGTLTRRAVQKFQQEQNIAPASGYFGPLTKKRMLNLIRLRSVSF